MQLGKTYTTTTGAKRTPLLYSKCNKFIFVFCEYKDGKTLTKYFCKNHKLFND